MVEIPDDGFLVLFPLYMLLSPPFPLDPVTKRLVISHKTNFLTMTPPGENPCLVAFTDEDLAKRFVADTKHQRNNFLGVFPVETSDLLKEIVLMVHRARGHRVNLLLDISEKGAGPMVRYDEIVE